MTFPEYLSSRSHNEKVAALLRIERKQRIFSSAESALFLGFSKDKYEEWESAIAIPNFHEWAQICNRYGLDLDICRGILFDSGQAIEIRQTSNVRGFLLPARYSSWQGTANRWLISIVEFLRFQLGEVPFRKFCDKIEMDPDYFYLGDQLANFQLTHDLILELVQHIKGSDTETVIKSIVDAAFIDLRTDCITWLFESTKSHEPVFFGLKQFNKYLDLVFAYELVEVLDDGYYICASAADWVRSDLRLDGRVKSWYHRYKIEWFRRLLFAACRAKANIDVIELDDVEDPDCLFRVQIA